MSFIFGMIIGIVMGGLAGALAMKMGLGKKGEESIKKLGK